MQKQRPEVWRPHGPQNSSYPTQHEVSLFYYYITCSRLTSILIRTIKNREIQFNNTEGIVLADECTFTPTRGMLCSGGVTGGLNRRLQPGCPSSFDPPSCSGSCTACGGMDKPFCLSNQLKCKAASIQGLAFPFMDDPASVLGLLSGGDIVIIGTLFGHCLLYGQVDPSIIISSVYVHCF